MSHRRKSPLSLLAIIPLILFLFLLSVGFIWFKSASRAIDRSSSTRVNFSVYKGQGLDSIANDLKEKELIRSIPAFKLEVFVSNKSKKIQAGDFALTKAMSLSTLVEALTHGTTDRWVTFLEGWRREEMAQVLVDNLSPNNKDYSFNPDQFLILTKNLEGQLFPDTYSFPKTASTAAIINRLTSRFQEQTKGLTNNSDLTDYQALILASLIEREALSNDERPLVAGVLLNRLDSDWPLQVDATIQYLKTTRDCKLLTCNWWPNNLTKEDLAISSPYNTYLNPGLPSTPISNPSLVSIKAAYNPKKSNYWFYLHDSKGNIHFAKTLEEHNQNVTKYLGK